MMSERWLWDRFLFQIRVSGLIPEGGTILDVGTGLNTTVLEMFGDKWHVTPSDINVGEWNSHIPGMIELDVMKMSHQLGNLNPDGYDAVVLSEVLEHVTDPDAAMYQSWFVLKPGGILVVSAPFMYRIHEYGGDDTETSEPGLKDYWRFTPNGLRQLFIRQAFTECWVGRLVREDKQTFPEYYCPEGVVGWGTKVQDGILFNARDSQIQHEERDFLTKLPPDWRERQTRMAEEYERRIADAGKEVEPV